MSREGEASRRFCRAIIREKICDFDISSVDNLSTVSNLIIIRSRDMTYYLVQILLPLAILIQSNDAVS